VPINFTEFQLIFVLNSPAKIALRRAIALASGGGGASLGRVRLQILRRLHRTLCISVLPGTDGTGQMFVCLSEREHWSSHWAGSIEHSTLLY
jgi:hypothetical protein